MQPNPPLTRSPSNRLWFWPGVVLMIFALCCCQVTMVTRPGGPNPYRDVLTTALVAMAAADVCFVIVFVRGPILWRAAAVVGSLPSVFVVDEFIRRAF